MKRFLIASILTLTFLVGTSPAMATVGSACINPESTTECGASEYCDPASLTCKALSSAPTYTPSAGDSAAGIATPASGAAASGGTGGTQSTNFVPLLPALPLFTGSNSLTNSDSFSGFFSQLYKICIGIAAVLAVLQIMRAGVMYMGGDSITEKKEARDLIAMSLFGLLLVLAPTIVFSIINPKILQIDINAQSLKTSITQIQSANTSAPQTTTSNGLNCTALCSPKTGTVNATGGGCLCDGSPIQLQAAPVKAPDCSPTGGICSTGGTVDTKGTGCVCNAGSAPLTATPGTGPDCSPTGGICKNGGTPTGKGEGCYCNN